jgi:cation diffusion facilitator family transporter
MSFNICIRNLWRRNKRTSQSEAPLSGARVRERAMLLVFFIEAASVVPVLIVALLVGSLALLADWFTYLDSFFTSLLAWLTFRRIARDSKADYDYGLGKFESFSTLICSSLLIVSMLVVIVYSAWRIAHPVSLAESMTWLGVGEYLIELGFNVWLWRRNLRIARREYSPLMETQWRSNRNDALQNVGIMTSLLLTLLLEKWSWHVYIDPLMAMLIALYVITSYTGIFQKSLNDLLDKTLDESLQLLIVKQLAQHFNDYEDFHAVRSRRAGGTIFIELELGFDPEKTMREVHLAIERMTQNLEQEVAGSKVRVIIHPPSSQEQPA